MLMWCWDLDDHPFLVKLARELTKSNVDQVEYILIIKRNVNIHMLGKNNNLAREQLMVGYWPR